MKNFSVTNGKIVVSDPCYDSGDVRLLALNGKWLAAVRKTKEDVWGERVASVLVHHEGFDPIGKKYNEDVKYIGVDSGQAGVFDSEAYNASGNFYDSCCSATNKDFGFVSGGFVTTSGYGDGGYPARVYRHHGKAEAVEIVFIRN
jgi:hypothetical protein